MRRINAFSLVLASVATVILTGDFTTQPAYATIRSESLTATPVIVDIGGAAGTNIELSFYLTNNSESTIPIQMSTRDSRKKEGQSSELARAVSAKSWVVYKEPYLILHASETRQINATVKIPEHTSPGGHYADLIVQSLHLEGEGDVVNAQPELAVQMLVSVTGDITERLDIGQKGLSIAILDQSTSKSLTYHVKNSGNIHTLFTPKIRIEAKGKKIAEKSLQAVIILPGEHKVISATLPEGLKPGYYTAKMSFNYGAPSREATSPPVHLVVLPFAPEFLYILPLFAVIVYAYRSRRKLSAAAKIVLKGE